MSDRPEMSYVSEIEGRIKSLLENFPPTKTQHEAFWGAQFDLGLAWVYFPPGLGGLGAPPSLQELVDSTLAKAGAPSNFARNPIGIGMGAPTVLSHGSKELAEEVLRPMFTCKEIWCQLFSEPSAGSDLASISTKAVRDGDEWIVNGQKVWTTLAHVSKWGMLLTRSDSEQTKHKGMTYFVLEMNSPGVEVRPLRQITGEAEFNEVYFEDVRIPDSNRLGGVGEGWSVAITTLMNERLSIGGNLTERGSGAIGDALRVWSQLKIKDPVRRDELAKLWSASEANRLTNIRAAQRRQMGTPGPEGSVAKLAYAELNKKIYSFCIDLLGAKGLLYPSYEMVRPETTRMGTAVPIGEIAKAFLRTRANSIEGGTSEIMKNILGERVLGLPPEPRFDKDKPWSQVPRN